MKIVYTDTSSYLCEDTKLMEVGNRVFDIANKKWFHVSAPGALTDILAVKSETEEESTDSNITFPSDGEEDSDIPEELEPSDEVMTEE